MKKNKDLISQDCYDLVLNLGYSDKQPIIKSEYRNYTDAHGNELGYGYYTYQQVFEEVYPTQAKIQTWLRDEYNIHIVIRTGNNDNEPWFSFFVQSIKGEDIFFEDEDVYDDSGWETYEETLEKALLVTLNKIKNK